MRYVGTRDDRDFSTYPATEITLASYTKVDASAAWTVGAIVQPRFIPGLTATVDWVDIELTNAITTLETITGWLEDQIVRPLIELQWMLQGIWPESYTYQVIWPKKGVVTPAVLKDLDLTREILIATVEGAGQIPVTVKIRTGWDEEHPV